MRALAWLRKRLLITQRYFAHREKSLERRSFGLGQFVLLLTLAPFIFSLTLYDFASTHSVASKYQIDPDRFTDLNYVQLGKPTLGLALEVIERIEERGLTAESLCGIQSKKSLEIQRLWWQENMSSNPDFPSFRQYCDRYKSDPFLHRKPVKDTPPKIDVIEMSQSHFMVLQDQVAVSESDLPKTALDSNSSRSVRQGIGEKIVGASSFQVLTYPLWLVCFLLLFPTIAIAIKRRAWGLIVCGLSIPAINYTAYLVSLLFGVELLAPLHSMSPLFAQIAFAWFLVRGRISSKAFWIFVLLLFVATLIPLFIGSVPIIESRFVSDENYSLVKAQLPIIIFIAVAAIGRLLVMGAKENMTLLTGLGLANGFKFSMRALLLWLPMAALCLPFFYLTSVFFPKTITTQLYQNGLLQFDYQYEKGFLDNALQSAAHKTDDINFAWHLVIEERKAYLSAADQKLQETDFKETVANHYDEIFPENIEFEEPKSGVFLVGWLVDISTEQTQESINTAYVDIKNEIKGNLESLVGQKEQEIKALARENKVKAVAELEKLKQEGKEVILANNTAVQSSIWWTITYLHAAHQLTLILFAFICVKSFLYVFARVSFNQDTQIVVTLDESSSRTSPEPESHIKATGLEYVIDSAREETFYITRRFQCRGKAPKLSVPQALHAPFARLFSKAYIMNEVVMKKGDPEVRCTATRGIEFFEWELAKNETVVFDFSNFVGMTKGLTISTLVSPRISSLLLGKMIYSQATGPGKLVLMAEGRAEVCGSHSNTGCFPPERTIAMRKDTELYVDSELDILNIYLSAAHIRPVSGKMIVDVDSQRGSKSGLGSFARHFIFPG